jgi:hypothetical protein
MVNDGTPSGVANNVEMIRIPQNEVVDYEGLVTESRLNERSFRRQRPDQVVYRALCDIHPGDEILVAYCSGYWDDLKLSRCRINVLEAFDQRIDLVTDVVHPRGDIGPDTRIYKVYVLAYGKDEHAGDTITYTLAELNAANKLCLVAQCESASQVTMQFGEALELAADPLCCSPDELERICVEEIERSTKQAKKQARKKP